MRLTFGKKISEMVKGSMVAAKDRTLADTKRMAQDTLEYAAKISPQYSGTFASNWRLSINVPRAGTHEKPYNYWTPRPGSPEQEGSQPAVSKAMSSPGVKLSGLKLGDRIYLATAAYSADGEQYHWDIEGGLVRFRADNPTARFSKGQILELARQHLKALNAGKLR